MHLIAFRSTYSYLIIFNFSVHPLHVDALQASILCSFFFLGSEFYLVALLRYIRTIVWVLKMSMSVTSCSDLCWISASTYLPSRSPWTCPEWNLPAPCTQPGQSLAPHAACWQEWPYQSHNHSRPKPKGHPPYYPLPYLASHQSKSHQFCFTNSSLLPLSLPNPDQIHHHFPGHLKQPSDLSFSLQCFLPLSQSTLHPSSQLSSKNELRPLLPPLLPNRPKTDDQTERGMSCQPLWLDGDRSPCFPSLTVC